MGLFKESFIMYSFSENSGGKLQEQEALVFQFPLQKFLILFLWYIQNFYSSMSKTLHCGSIACPLFNNIVLIRIGFSNWDV